MARIRAQAGVLGDRLHVLGPVPPDALHGLLSAADCGVVAIPPTPSQAFRTPVKTAHYWAAGLPIIIPVGVSDDHRIATDENTGVALRDLAPDEAARAAAALARWRSEDPATLRARCAAGAFTHRDTAAMVRTLRDLLLGQG